MADMAAVGCIYTASNSTTTTTTTTTLVDIPVIPSRFQRRESCLHDGESTCYITLWRLPYAEEAQRASSRVLS